MDKSFTGFPQIVFGTDFCLLRDILSAHTFWTLSRERPDTQLRVADVALAIVRIVLKRNLLNVLAFFKEQVETFVRHGRTLESYDAFIRKWYDRPIAVK